MSNPVYNVIRAHNELHKLIGEFADKYRIGINIDYLQSIQTYCRTRIEHEAKFLIQNRLPSFEEIETVIKQSELE